jgi:DNA-binding transcriptional MocR family regulator
LVKDQTAAIQQVTFSGRKIFSAGNKYENCIRICFGKPWNDDVDYGLMMLGKLIKKMI